MREYKKDKGFSITVVIFVTVIITIVVGVCIALVNYNWKMKEIQRVTTQTTYSAEDGMNIIMQNLQLECEEQMKKAYSSALIGSSGLTDSAINTKFKTEYIENLNTKFALDTDGILSAYLTATPEYTLVGGTTLEMDNSSKFVFTFKDVGVTYTNGEVQETAMTDIAVTAPDLFGSLQTENNLINSYSQYALITDGTISFNQQNTNVLGNIYAGGKKQGDTDYTNGLLINENSTGVNANLKSDAIVTRGDIRVQSGGKLTVIKNNSKSNCDVYAKNIVTDYKPGKELSSHTNILDMDANIHVKNDLLLNLPYGDILLKGKYYGFSDEKTDDPSSISINAKNVTADLTGLSELYIAGVSQISVPIAENVKAVGTGESLSAKFVQSIYLAPADCIYDKTGTTLLGNPTKTDEIVFDELKYYEKNGINIAKYLDEKQPVFGVRPKDSVDMPHVAEDRIYWYLNFKNSASAAAYLREYNRYFNEYLDDRAKSFKYGNLTLGSGATLRTVGNIIANDGNNISVLPNRYDVGDAIDKELIDRENQAQSRSYGSLASTLLSYEYTNISDINDSLYTYIINTEKVDNPEKYVYISYDDAGEETRFESEEPFEQGNVTDTYFSADDIVAYIKDSQDSSGNKYQALVCRGDITVLANQPIYGIIVTNGTVTLNDNADFHGTIIAKGGINFIGDHSSVVNTGYESPALSWFLNTYVNQNIIREKFRQISTIENISNDKSLDIKYQNWSVY